MAHDFRGMFNTFLWMLNSYDDRLISKDDFIEMLPEIKVRAKLNATLINDTLQWINMQDAGFTPRNETVKIYQLYEELQERFEHDLLNKSIRFIYEGEKDIDFKSDQLLIKFILGRLVDNAIKHSHSHSLIRLDAEQLTGRIRLSIKDQGEGMDVATLKNLFSLEGAPYPGTQGEMGVGVSLILVRDLIHLLEGELKIESQEKIGTTAICTFLQQNTSPSSPDSL